MPSKLLCLFFLLSLTVNLCICMNEEEQKEAMEKIMRELAERNLLRTGGGAASSSTARGPPGSGQTVSSADLTRIISEQGSRTPTRGHPVSSADLSRIIGSQGSRTPGHPVSSADLSRIIDQPGSSTPGRKGKTVSSAELSRITGQKGPTPRHPVSSADLSRIIEQQAPATPSRKGKTVSSAELSRITSSPGSRTPGHPVSSADLSRIIEQQGSATPSRTPTQQLKQSSRSMLSKLINVLHKKSSSKSSSEEENRGKGKILYFSTNKFYSHFILDLLLAKILHDDGYVVHFFVNNYRTSEPLQEMSANYEFLFVPVDFNEPTDKEVTKFTGKNYDKMAYDVVIGIFQAFASNQRILINHKEERLHNWLSQQNYDLGISEYAISIGAFYIFNLLGIGSKISTSAIPPQISLLEMLGIDASKLPDYRAVRPGKTKSYPWKRGDPNYEANRQAYKSTKEFFAEYSRNAFDYFKFAKILRIRNRKDGKGLVGPSSIDDLFRSVKFLLVNQHWLANYKNMPESNRLFYIGGIHVEERGMLLNKSFPVSDEELLRQTDCLILYNMGTVVKLSNPEISGIHAMFRAMSSCQACRFIVRINQKFVPYTYDRERIHVTDQFIDQQEILARSNTKAFISHCGQNSLLEAMYAGVPLICIPFSGDQPYNSALVEYLRIGFWLERAEVHVTIDEVLAVFAKPGNRFHKNAVALAKRIRSEIDHNRMALKRNIFLWAVAQAINGGARGGGGGAGGGGGGFPPSPFTGPNTPRHSSAAPFSPIGGGVGAGSSSSAGRPARQQGTGHPGGEKLKGHFSPEKSPIHPGTALLTSIWESMKNKQPEN